MESRIAMHRLVLLVAIVLLLLPAVLEYPPRNAVLAQSGGPYDLSWNTIDGGGMTFSSGGPYTLGGTIGQADAGILTGGSYVLQGGFWVGGGIVRFRVYLPLVLRNSP